MSNAQFAFVERARVPSRAALQASISALGFELQLDPGFLPFENSGFLPFVLNGGDGPGFEIDYLDAATRRLGRARRSGRGFYDDPDLIDARCKQFALAHALYEDDTAQPLKEL